MAGRQSTPCLDNNNDKCDKKYTLPWPYYMSSYSGALVTQQQYTHAINNYACITARSIISALQPNQLRLGVPVQFRDELPLGGGGRGHVTFEILGGRGLAPPEPKSSL
eukprot:787186-Prorocentrum_minimum.AAC.1